MTGIYDFKKEKDYLKKATLFLELTKTTLKAKFIKNDLYFTSDKEPRDIYQITLKRQGRKKVVFKFAQSLVGKNTEPSYHAILACLQKYEVGTFENFCDESGITNSIGAKKTYKMVLKEFDNVQKIWSENEIELLRDIN